MSVSPADQTSKRRRTARIARSTGTVAWWLFVVARLVTEMNTYGPYRYTSYLPLTLFGIGQGSTECDFTNYAPITDYGARVGPGLGFHSIDVFSAIALLSFVVLMIAAVTEAMTTRSWLSVAVPVGAAAIILVALHDRTSLSSDSQMNQYIVFVLVLAGIGIREVWSRRHTVDSAAPTAIA